MELIAFLAGVCVTLGVLLLLLPWIRQLPAAQSLAEASWKSVVAALVLLAMAAGLHHRADAPSRAVATDSTAIPAAATATAATDTPPAATRAPGGASAAGAKPAGSMGSAVASLEARLAKGGGTPADWELLAKSFEFLGRPDDAAKARAHELPPPPVENDPLAIGAALPAGPMPTPSAAAPAATAGTGTVVSGEVTLAPALARKVAAGTTLFIVAKSVDTPGPPLAVYRAAVGAWPLGFSLDDSQAMLPGRNLSSASRVTIEARISPSGQAMPASGDLQGTSGVIKPSARRPISILIDRVID